MCQLLQVALDRLRSHTLSDESLLNCEAINTLTECVSHSNPFQHYAGLDLRETSVEIMEVAGRCPLSRAQFQQVNQLWPVNFLPDKGLEKLLQENCGFEDLELTEIQRNVETVMGHSITSGGVPACLVYDPAESSKEIIVCATGMPTEALPLRHAVSVATDAIAVLQGGTALSLTQIHKFHLPNIPRPVASSKRTRTEHGDYLCTGLDVYLSHEPCLMCAMTLLHARSNRVFFINSSERSGALSSITKLHCLSNINHRFNVYHIQIINYTNFLI